MVDGTLGINEPDVIDKLIDSEEIVVGLNTVNRERIQVTGLAATDIAVVTAANGLEVDITRVLPGVGALNLGKAEDTLHSDGDVGVMALGVRNDAVTALAGDGDYHPMMFNVNGRLLVQTEGGGGGTAAVDDAPYTLAVDSGTPAMGFFGDAAPDSVDDGDAGVLRMSANRNLYATLRDAAGNERGVNVTAANELNVIASAQPGVNIGDVDVLSVIPGVGATNLGKAEDAIHANGDVGIAILGVLQDDKTGVGADANGDYANPNIDSRGRMRVSPGGQTIIDPFQATAGWAVINDDAGNLATDLDHVAGTLSLIFDKLDGASNTVFAMIDKTIASISLNNIATGALFLQTVVKIPDLTNVVNVVFRLGTDNANYNEWKIPTADAVANIWEIFRAVFGNSTGSTGNGWNLTAITWISVGLEFLLETNTLVGFQFDSLTATGGQVHSTDTTTEITAQVTTPNINLLKIGGAVVDRNIGVAGNGSQRVTIATDNTVTVDAPIGTPVNVQVGDGTDALGIYTEDVPAVADPIGLAQVIVRQDTPAGLTTTDGDNVARRGTDFGAAYSQIITSAGAFVDTFGGGTQFAVDDPLGATPTGTLAIARRDTVLSALTPVDDDAVALHVDGFGALWNTLSADDGARIPADSTDGLKVNLGTDNDVIVTNAGTFAIQDTEKLADNTPFVDGTTPVQPVGYIFDEVAGTALTENDIAAARIDAKRAQVLVIEDASTRGQRANVSAGGALDVEVTTSVLPSGAATATNQTSVIGTDGAAGPANVLSIGGTEAGGNIQEIQVDADGQLQIDVITSALPSGAATLANQQTDGLTDTELRATAVPISAASLPLPAGAATSALQLPDGHAVTAVGTIATDLDGSAVDPVLTGGIAQEIDDSAPPNRVSAENDVTHLSMSRDGAIFVAGGGPQQWFSSNLYTGSQSDDSLHAAPGAGLQLMITDIYFAADAAQDFTLEADDVADEFLYGYFASGQGDGVTARLATPIPVGDNRALLFTSPNAVDHIVVVGGHIQPV